jgi:hypothetical protein
MRFTTLQKFRKLFGVLVATVMLGLLIVMLFVAHVLNQSRLRYYASAETSHNLVVSLENFLHSHFRRWRLAMRRADLEFRRMHGRRFSDAAFSDYLRDLKERMPQAQAVRGSNAAGLVIYGEQVDLDNPQDLTIREFYARADRAPADLRRAGQVAHQRRVGAAAGLSADLPDGGFGGTAYVVMNSARISEAFAGLNIGAHGSIVLLDDRRRVLHRYPEVPDMPLAAPSRSMPPPRRCWTAGKRASYTVLSPRDGRSTISVEKVGAYPVYIVVGLASDDFLAVAAQVRNALLFVGVLMGLSAALLLGVRYGLNKQYQVLSALGESDRRLQASLARLTASESRWRSLTEGLPQMVWTATPELRIDFMSHHWKASAACRPRS